MDFHCACKFTARKPHHNFIAVEIVCGRVQICKSRGLHVLWRLKWYCGVKVQPERRRTPRNVQRGAVPNESARRKPKVLLLVQYLSRSSAASVVPGVDARGHCVGGTKSGGLCSHPPCPLEPGGVCAATTTAAYPNFALYKHTRASTCQRRHGVE